MFAEVAVDSLEQVRPRSVGVESVALHAIEQLGLAAILTECGFNGKLKNAALASVIGRLAHPGSELATWRWLTATSALGELMEVDFEAMSLMTLYRASDGLIAHRAAIETRLFENVRDLFGLDTTVTLYDLTNTYFEGTAAANPKAARGAPRKNAAIVHSLPWGSCSMVAALCAAQRPLPAMRRRSRRSQRCWPGSMPPAAASS